LDAGLDSTRDCVESIDQLDLLKIHTTLSARADRVRPCIMTLACLENALPINGLSPSLESARQPLRCFGISVCSGGFFLNVAANGNDLEAVSADRTGDTA
jgi:hypothetical protein